MEYVRIPKVRLILEARYSIFHSAYFGLDGNTIFNSHRDAADLDEKGKEV